MEVYEQRWWMNDNDEAGQYLDNLHRMKRECVAFLKNAEARGDRREALEFQEQLERVEAMIEQSGGDPESGDRPDL
jgi:hypothetical protein